MTSGPPQLTDILRVSAACLKGAKSGRSSLNIASHALGSSGNPKDAIELRRLLRMRGERPRHRAADKLKEISPFQ